MIVGRSFPRATELVAALGIVVFAAAPSGAAEATLVGMRGAVLLDGAAARRATPLRAGQVLSTGPTSEATILLPDGSVFTVRGGTRMRLSRLLLEGGARSVRVDLEGGGVLSEVAPSRLTHGDFEVGTPVAVAGVRGTSFHSEFAGGEASFDVFAGKIEVASPTGAFRPMELGAGQRLSASGSGRVRHAVARADRAPSGNRPSLGAEGGLPQGGGPGGQAPGGQGPQGQEPGGRGPGGQSPSGQGPGGQGPQGQGTQGGPAGGPGGVNGPGGMSARGPGGPGPGMGQGMMAPGGMMMRPGGGMMGPGGMMGGPQIMLPPPQLAVPPLAQPPPPPPQ